ncbi:DUF502 domain-containing protein [Aliiglaciecola sp. CAU 1673]|uniref:DUF502 domain-containing protein n=1 Tax=Aliiglaciecola sp. CAU 1673 TaxID=3032595 RepID=UPI0023DCA2B4|nr:DUF502 domain-containing protein [Aliiglaciecola sp. CAU 1673]MDF2180083.1 DUF502 domain-containing protein [Aliiglaciecola sp. CAU 1673]
MSSVSQAFTRGLLFALPLAITFGALYWFFNWSESLLSQPLQFILPQGWYVTGMGLVFGLVLIFLLGLLVQAYLIKHLFCFMESLLERIPLVKTLYGSSKDILRLLGGEGQGELQKVVLVTLHEDIRMIGFVTNEQVNMGMGEDIIAVYLPLSYQVGGHLLYLPRDRCEPLDMPVQQAMQQVLTGHIRQSSTRESRKRNG